MGKAKPNVLGTGRSIPVAQSTRESLANVVHNKAVVIGRSGLSNVEASEILVQGFCKGNNVCICRIRGMTYSIDTTPGKEKLGIYDPLTSATGSGCKVRRTGISAEAEERR